MDTKETKRPRNLGDFVVEHADNGGTVVRHYSRNLGDVGRQLAAHTTPAEMITWLAEQYGVGIKPKPVAVDYPPAPMPGKDVREMAERLHRDARQRCQDAEREPASDRKWAEGLIRQLPEKHEGRNSWLLNFGTGPVVEKMRDEHPTYRKLEALGPNPDYVEPPARYQWKTREDFVAALTMAVSVQEKTSGRYGSVPTALQARALADIIDSVHEQGIGE